MKSKHRNFPVTIYGPGDKTSQAGSAKWKIQAAQANNSESVALSSQLIQLEKNDRLLLVDGFHVMPLLIYQGKDFIKNYLKFCSEVRDKRTILEAFPDRVLFNALVSHGIIRLENKEEEDILLKSEPCHNSLNQNSDAKIPRISLYILLTQYCNLGCIYCLNGNKSYQKDNRLKMNRRVAEQAVLRHLDLLAPGGTLEIVFFGGEPLLNWPLAKKIIQICESKFKKSHGDRNWKYHFTTNLTVLPKDLIDWAQRYQISFLVNIDGPEQIHNTTRPALNHRFNSYQATIKNLDLLIKSGIRPGLRATITSYNVDRLDEISWLHKTLGGQSSALITLMPVNSDEMLLPQEYYPDADCYRVNLEKAIASNSWDTQDVYSLREYLSRIRPHNRIFVACGAPNGGTPTVDVNGDVYVCIYLVGSPKYYVGNVFDSDYPRKRVLQKLAEYLNVDRNPVCAHCAYRYICGGGCPVRRLRVEDNRNASPSVRRYAREIVCTEAVTIINHLLWQLAEDASHKFVHENQLLSQSGNFCV